MYKYINRQNDTEIQFKSVVIFSIQTPVFTYWHIQFSAWCSVFSLSLLLYLSTVATSVTNTLNSPRYNVGHVWEPQKRIRVFKCTKHWPSGWRKRSAVTQHFIQILLCEGHMMLNTLRLDWLDCVIIFNPSSENHCCSRGKERDVVWMLFYCWTVIDSEIIEWQ